jgi:hypothetical protein
LAASDMRILFLKVNNIAIKCFFKETKHHCLSEGSTVVSPTRRLYELEAPTVKDTRAAPLLQNRSSHSFRLHDHDAAVQLKLGSAALTHSLRNLRPHHGATAPFVTREMTSSGMSHISRSARQPHQQPTTLCALPGSDLRGEVAFVAKKRRYAAEKRRLCSCPH